MRKNLPSLIGENNHGKIDVTKLHYHYHAQLRTYAYKVILNGQNIPLKYYQPLELLMYIGRGFRSFHTGNMGSVVQRTVKLLSIKL